MKSKILLFVFLSLVTLSYSQVGINTENPNSLAELDIVNIVNQGIVIPKGVMVPRMSEVDRNRINTSDPSYANGLWIYNTDENCFNYFSGATNRWKSVCGEIGKAKFNLICANSEVVGVYKRGQPLNNSNIVKLTVNVTKAGSYEITIPSGNGYFFAVTGIFPETGVFVILANGSGTPLASKTDTAKIYNYGNDMECKVSIQILPDAATYTMSCSISSGTEIQANPNTSTGVFGSYKLGQAVNPTKHFIRMKVNVTTTGSWEASTNSIDGLSFSGAGIFTTLGTNYIVLQASGTPRTQYDKSFVILTNSAGGENTSCTVLLRMTILKKRILSVGSNSWSITGTSGAGNMFKNIANFGEADYSTFKVVTPDMYPTSGSISGLQVNRANILKYIDPSQPNTLCDILVFTHTNEIATDVVEELISYVRNGGVLLMFNEHMNSFMGNNKISNYQFMQRLFGDNSMVFVGGETANIYQLPGAVMKLPSINDPIINGPFGDLRNQFIGEDQGWADFIITSTLDPRHVEWSYNSADYSVNRENPAGSPQNGTSSTATDGKVYPKGSVFTAGFKAKDYNFFWAGDGGFSAGTTDPSNRSAYPVLLTTSGFRPIAKPNYGSSVNRFAVYNSFLFANLISWAFYQAETDGIRKRFGYN